jgi:hypothetical protein
MNLTGKTKVLVLTSQCDLSTVDMGIEGKLADKGKALRSMRELLATVLKSYCRERLIKPEDLKFEIADRVQEGLIGASLYVSTEYLRQPDLHNQNCSLQQELMDLLSQSVNAHNTKSKDLDPETNDGSPPRSYSEPEDPAVLDCAFRLSGFANGLPDNLVVSQDSTGGNGVSAVSFKLNHVEQPIKTLPFPIEGTIVCVLSGYNYNSRILNINTGKRCYDLTCDVDKLDAIRHFVDGRSWREIRIRGKSSRADTAILSAENLSFVTISTERCYAVDPATTN